MLEMPNIPTARRLQHGRYGRRCLRRHQSMHVVRHENPGMDGNFVATGIPIEPMG
jgi:hypothetical protein